MPLPLLGPAGELSWPEPGPKYKERIQATLRLTWREIVAPLSVVRSGDVRTQFALRTWPWENRLITRGRVRTFYSADTDLLLIHE